MDFSLLYLKFYIFNLFISFGGKVLVFTCSLLGFQPIKRPILETTPCRFLPLDIRDASTNGGEHQFKNNNNIYLIPNPLIVAKITTKVDFLTENIGMISSQPSMHQSPFAFHLFGSLLPPHFSRSAPLLPHTCSNRKI